MCGIAGVLADPMTKASIRQLMKVTVSLRHRGPDDEGYALLAPGRASENLRGDATVRELTHLAHVHETQPSQAHRGAFGHTRLSILDLSAAGHQPMTESTGRYTLVYNGEIFNFLELRRTLESFGYQFASTSDTEVVLKAILHWGMDALHRMNGMWAFALWDSKEGTLVLARDRFGVKPLYYVEGKEGFFFASEARALRRAGVASAAVDEDRIWDYLVLGVADHSQHTLLREVRQVLPGHYLLKRPFELARTVRYYSLGGSESLGQFDRGEAARFASRFIDLLNDSVTLRLRSDVPVAMFLSGGLDSGLITSLAARNRNSVTTFSAIYPGTGFDESKQIARTLKYCPGVDARFISPQDNLLADLLQFVDILDEPLTSAGPYAQYRLLKQIRGQGFKVILAGDGADEYTGGYPDLCFPRLITDLAAHRRVLQLIRECLALGPRRFFRFAAKSAVDSLPTGLRWRLLRTLSSVVAPAVRCLNQEFVRSRAHRANEWIDRQPRGCLQRGLRLDVERSTLCSNLRYADRNSMAHSVELRVPFMDYRLIEFLSEVPGVYKLRSGWNKWLTRMAAEGYLPDEIRWRRSKRGFGEAEANSFRAAWEQLTADGITASEYLDAGGIDRGRQMGTAVQYDARRVSLWRILNLELWMRSMQAAVVTEVAVHSSVPPVINVQNRAARYSV